MGKFKDFDFDRAKSLMDFIVSAGNHGPMYHKLLGLAQQELREMVEEVEQKEKEDQLVTPAAGPPNAAVVHPDGSYEEVKPKLPNQQDSDEDERQKERDAYERQQTVERRV